jgi:two-component system heavy metal sensor histidine kinase CusS
MLVHLSAAFAAGFLVLVGALVLFLDESLVRTVYAQIDKDLLDAAKVTLHRLEEDHYPLDKELLDLGDNLFLRVTGSDGRSRLESPDMARLAPPGDFALPGESWTWVESSPASPLRVKVVSVRYSNGWIQVARDMHPEVKVLGQFRQYLWWSLAIIPFLGALLGYVLVKIGLWPLRTVATGARAVGPESLGYRIDSSLLPMELDPLCRDLNRTFQRLEEGFERLSGLNGDLAHEMRTPLHSIRLELERILDQGGLSPDLEEALSDMSETGAHLAALLEQMIFLARVENPSMHIEKTAIDPGRLLEQARAPFEALAEEKAVRIDLQMTGRPDLRGDPTLLRRALHNLLGNALRHSPEGGCITLKAHGDAHATVLEVADQGPGLPEPLRKRLGQRFLRAEDARGRASGGSGLGLAIVQGIAKLHGARLSFAEGQSSGCRALITFPRT